MRREGIIALILVTVMISVLGGCQKKEAKVYPEAKVVLYPGPESLKDATADDLKNVSENGRDMALLHCTDTSVTINGEECYVYDTNVNHCRTWNVDYLPKISRTPVTYFDFEGCVEVTVRVKERTISTAEVSPLSENITPVVDVEAGTVTFQISTPGAYTVTFDDSHKRAVHIFANALEENVPSADDENVIYYGPGEWEVGTLQLKSGQTLYVAGGAVLHGEVAASYAQNVTICGRGIIDGSLNAGWKGNSAKVPIRFDKCKNVELRDVLVLNSNAWVCQMNGTTNGLVDGAKIISARPNGDGITLQSCKDIVVQNGFVRSWDDSVVVKNYSTSSENITVQNMQLWTDLAQSMEIGYETNKGRMNDSYIRNIVFRDITVLQNFHKPVISVHNADDALVEDILFEGITIENEKIGSGDGSVLPYLIDIAIVENENWSSTVNRGTIRNVRIKDVNLLKGNRVASRITGFDEEHKAEGVVIENLQIFGEKMTSFEEAGFVVDENTTEDIVIR